MKKSNRVFLTLLASMSMAVTSCGDKQPPPPTPYDDYTYYGRSDEQGQASSHFVNGMLEWYLISRMFNGYGYYPPNYYRRPFGYGGSGFAGYGFARGYGGEIDATHGSASAMHSATARGGFGGTGYGHGGGA